MNKKQMIEKLLTIANSYCKGVHSNLKNSVPDFEKAAFYFEKAAGLGSTIACRKLSRMYEDGYISTEYDISNFGKMEYDEKNFAIYLAEISSAQKQENNTQDTVKKRYGKNVALILFKRNNPGILKSR